MKGKRYLNCCHAGIIRGFIFLAFPVSISEYFRIQYLEVSCRKICILQLYVISYYTVDGQILRVLQHKHMFVLIDRIFSLLAMHVLEFWLLLTSTNITYTVRKKTKRKKRKSFPNQNALGSASRSDSTERRNTNENFFCAFMHKQGFS